MDFCQINPYIRFAGVVRYQSSGYTTFVRDCRIFYILSGWAEILTEGQHYSLQPHSVFYCRGGSQYTILSDGVELISLNFDLTQERSDAADPFSPIKITDGCKLPAYEHAKVADCDYLNSHLLLPEGMRCRDTLERILKEFATQRILYRETCSALLKSLLVQLHRHSIGSQDQAGKAVKQITAYIHENFHTGLSNTQFSKMTGYHEYHLNRLFLKHTGFTIHRYILNVRLSHAKQMLLNTDLTLSAIAEQTGFNSNTHFSSYFKQSVGMAPLEFRKRFQNTI